MIALVAAWACALAAGQAASPAPAPFERLARAPFERLARWTTLTVSHAPGVHDDAADEAARLSRSDLDLVLDEIAEATRLLERAARDGRGPDAVVNTGGGRIPVSALGGLLGVPAGDLPSLFASARPEGADDLRSAVGRLLERGAVLHADVAILVPPLVRLVRDVEPGTRATLRVEDGRAGGIERTAEGHATVHFTFGNRLLGSRSGNVRPEAQRAWYRATSAYQLAHEMYADVLPHLADARATLPDDPVILFYSGALHEVFALPRSQAVVQSVELPPGMEHAVGAAAEELQSAATFYRQAIERDPAFHLAVLHYGRAVDQLGDHAAGRAALERARPALDDRPSQYYAELFLGDASRNLGDLERARAHYTRASELYPRAQTPGLALSALARERGGREHAVDVLRAALSRRVGRSLHDDPWWTYYRAHVADNGGLLAALRETLSLTAGR